MKIQRPISGSHRVVRRFAVFPREVQDLLREEVYLCHYYHVQHYAYRIGWIDTFLAGRVYTWADFSTSEAAEEKRKELEIAALSHKG